MFAKSIFDYIPSMGAVQTILGVTWVLLEFLLNSTVVAARSFDWIFTYIEAYTGVGKGDQAFVLSSVGMGLYLLSGSLFKLYYVLAAIRALINWFYQIITNVWNRIHFRFLVSDFRYGKRTKLIFPSGSHSAFSPITGLVLEGAHSTGSYMEKTSDAPKGVFQVFMPDEELKGCKLIGHGFCVGETLYTAAHVVEPVTSKVFVKNPARDSIFEISGFSLVGDLDCAQLHLTGAAAKLGLKSLSWRCINDDAPIILPSYDSLAKTWLLQSVSSVPDKSMPFHVLTRSNTYPGDSGMPLLQNGQVVAVHIGSHSKRRVNVHEVPYVFFLDEIEKRAEKRAPIFDGRLDRESPTARGNSIDRFRLIAKLKAKAQEEFAAKRSKGAIADSEGQLRLKTLADRARVEDAFMLFYKSKFGTGKYEDLANNWADYEDEFDEFEREFDPYSDFTLETGKMMGNRNSARSKALKEMLPPPLQSSGPVAPVSLAVGSSLRSGPQSTPAVSSSSTVIVAQTSRPSSTPELPRLLRPHTSPPFATASEKSAPALFQASKRFIRRRVEAMLKLGDSTLIVKELRELADEVEEKSVPQPTSAPPTGAL